MKMIRGECMASFFPSYEDSFSNHETLQTLIVLMNDEVT